MATANSLVFVQIVFRHGNRTPATSFPTDKHKDNHFKPYGQGQLTHQGKKESFSLGKILRGLYGSLLGDEYDPDVLYSVTSGMARTELTLQCVHAGLFPIRKDKQLEEGLTWQPILYDVYPKSGDKYLAYHRYNNSLLDVHRKLDPETQKLYDYVSQHAGTKIQTSHCFFKVQNAIQVQAELGLEPPSWAKSIPSEVMMDHTLNFWEDLATLRLPDVAGPLVQLITNNFNAKVNSDKGFEERKICLFSGHDLNIVALLGAFNSFKRKYTGYCSFIAMELHLIDEKYFVKIVFQNGLDETTRKPLKIIPSMSEDFCTLDEFINATKWLYTSES